MNTRNAIAKLTALRLVMVLIRIPKEDLPAWKKLTEWSDADFAAFVASISQCSATLTSNQFESQLAEKFPLLTPAGLTQLLNALFGAYYFKNRNDYEADELATMIAEAAEELHPQDFPKNTASVLASRLKELLRFDRSLGVTAKALDVMTENARTFCGARILSDLRPVFAESPSVASAAAVIHNLQLGYHDATGEHKEFYISLDTQDLETLREIIDRAEEKTEAIKAILESAKIPYLEPE